MIVSNSKIRQIINLRRVQMGIDSQREQAGRTKGQQNSTLKVRLDCGPSATDIEVNPTLSHANY